MADVKTILEKLDLEDLEADKKSSTQFSFEELTEKQILEINDELKDPQRYGGYLGIARRYEISIAQVKTIADIRKKVIVAKKELVIKDPEKPIEEPIKGGNFE